MLKYSGYDMNLEDARKFAVKQGIDPVPLRPAHDAMLCDKFNVWLRKENIHNVRAVGVDVMQDGIPVNHLPWITRKRVGPPQISVYEEEPKDIAAKEWLAAMGRTSMEFTTRVGATVERLEPRYFIPEIVTPSGAKCLTC